MFASVNLISSLVLANGNLNKKSIAIGGEAGGGGCLGQENFAKMWLNLINELKIDSHLIVNSPETTELLSHYKNYGEVLRSAIRTDGIIRCSGKSGFYSKDGDLLQAFTTPLKEVILADKFFEIIDRPGICSLVFKEMNRYLGGRFFKEALLRSTLASHSDCTYGIARPPGFLDLFKKDELSSSDIQSLRFIRTNEDHILVQFCSNTYGSESASCLGYADIDYNEIQTYLSDLKKQSETINLTMNAIVNVLKNHEGKDRVKQQLLMLLYVGVPAYFYIGFKLAPEIAAIYGRGIFIAGLSLIIYNTYKYSEQSEIDFLKKAVDWVNENFDKQNLQPGTYIDLQVDFAHFQELL